MAWHSPRDIRDCANKPATQGRATACRTELCRSGWDRRAGRLNSTATRRFIARKTFRLIQETRVPDAQVRVSTGPTASGSDRPIPEEAKGTLTWRMVTLATLPMPCRVIAVIQDVLPRQSIRSWNRQPTGEWDICCRARTCGGERLAAMDGRATGFVPGPGRNSLLPTPSLPRFVVVPRVADTGLAGTVQSVHGAHRWTCGLWSCR